MVVGISGADKEQGATPQCLCLVAPGLLLQTLTCSLCKHYWRSLSQMSSVLTGKVKSGMTPRPLLCRRQTTVLPSRRLYYLTRVLHWSEQEKETFQNNSIDFILLTSHLFKAVFSLEKKIPNLVTVIGSINSCGFEETRQNMLKRQMLWISQKFKWVECMCCSYTIFL